MNQSYKNNIGQIEQILSLLESNNFNLEFVNKKVDEGLIKMEECLMLLEKSEGKILIVVESKGKIDLEEFE